MFHRKNANQLEIVLTMTFLSDMYIDDDALRKQLNRILLVKTRNQIVQEIKSKGHKMHQFQLNNFLQRKDVTLSTLHKIDSYVTKEIYLNNLEPL
jgi:uncharacterized protein involved in tolerance to divalent cations